MAPQNPFNQKKASILAEIQSDQPDLSPKGNVDSLCLPIINLINSHNDMVTTSSCSGRISVFVEGQKEHNGAIKTGGKGEGGRWLYVTHNSDEVIGWLNRSQSEGLKFDQGGIGDVAEHVGGNSRLVLYKYEPFILHVKCRDFSTASKLYNVSMACGFRESGIGSNNLVAVRINIKLDVPIGYLNELTDEINLLVTADYIKFLDKLTLTKFQENEKKMKALHDRIKREIIDAPQSTIGKQLPPKKSKSTK